MLLNSKLVIKIYMSKYAIMFDNVVLILNFKVLKISVSGFKILNLKISVSDN